MGLVCQLVVQPVVRLVEFVVSLIEFILVSICRVVQEVVNVLTQVLTYVCNTVVKTVCGAVCGLVCGICGLFCGIFGCDCGCENLCNTVCNAVSQVVCGWTYIAKWLLQAITTVICDYLLRAILVVLHIIEALITYILTWVCTLIDLGIRWFLCWTYLADIFDSRAQRRFRVAPKIVPNDQGHSDWFVYVNNPDDKGQVDQTVRGFILGDQGRPLLPVADAESGGIGWFEVETRGDFITGRLRQGEGREKLVPGQPLLYYPGKVIEIASHLFGDLFAGTPPDDGRGGTPDKNLLTYNDNVQAWLASDGALAANLYNDWSGKYSTPTSGNFFGDRSLPDMGLRVDTDSTCSHPTNTFFHLVNGGIELAPPNTHVAESMSCGAGQTLSFEQTNFLMENKDADGSAVTTYLVSRYESDESSVGCNDLLGYTIVTFDGGDTPLFVKDKVLVYVADTNRMMSRIVQNVSQTSPAIVRVAETYIHECGHQCGLLHDSDAPTCENDATLHISKTMNPGGSVRRALTRLQWCLVRTSWYSSTSELTPFVQAPELPDSGSRP